MLALECCHDQPHSQNIGSELSVFIIETLRLGPEVQHDEITTFGLFNTVEIA